MPSPGKRGFITYFACFIPYIFPLVFLHLQLRFSSVFDPANIAVIIRVQLILSGDCCRRSKPIVGFNRIFLSQIKIGWSNNHHYEVPAMRSSDARIRCLACPGTVILSCFLTKIIAK